MGAHSRGASGDRVGVHRRVGEGRRTGRRLESVLMVGAGAHAWRGRVCAAHAYDVWRLAGPAEFPVAGLGLTVARRLAVGRHGGPDPAA